MKFSLRVMLQVIGCFSLIPADADVDIKGYLDTYQSIGLREPHRFMGSRTRIRLEGDFSLGDAWAFGSINAVYNHVLEQETGINLREAYVGWAADCFDLKAGNQIIIWGHSEGLYVTDNISPKDYSEALARDFDDMRIPVTAFRGRVLLGMFTGEFVWLPVFTPAVVPYRQKGISGDQDENPWAIPIDAALPAGKSPLPAKKLENSEIGVKLSLSASALDIAFSGLYTWDDIPVMHLSDAGIYPRYHRLAIWGIDAGIPIGIMVIRCEAALRLNDFFATRSGEQKSKTGVVGLAALDLSPGNDWNLSMQVHDTYITEYNSSFVAPHHDAYATLRISKELFRNTLTLSSMLFYGFDKNDSYCRISSKYALNDAISISAGVDLFDGKNGTFGQYAQNDAGFIECRYDF